MLRFLNINFTILILALVISVNCSSSDKKDPAKDATAKDSSAKDASTSSTGAKDASTSSTGAKDRSSDSTSSAPAEKEKVGMRGADESYGSQASLVDGPAGARPGQCWLKVNTPATFKEVSESVEKKAASERIEIVPAKYENVTENVVSKEASTKIETIPAVYETIQETKEIKPASKKIETIPAVYETVEEKVIDKEGFTEWKKDSSGLFCLVDVPPTYRTVKKDIVKVPAQTKETVIPAEFTTVSKQVLKTPATTKVVEVPAEIKPVTVQKIIEPAKEVKIPVPAEFQTITRKVKDQPEKSEWKEVLCENNANVAKISEVQNALKANGFDPGSTEGKFSSKTKSAVNDFQKSKGLLVNEDNHIFIDTLNALGVSKP